METPSNDESTSALARPERSTRPCSLRTETAVSGGASISRWVSNPASWPRPTSSRFVATLKNEPSPESRSSTRSANAFAFSSVGRKTILRSFTRTVPGAPAATRTSPNALRTSSFAPAPTARSEVCSNVYEGP